MHVELAASKQQSLSKDGTEREGGGFAVAVTESHFLLDRVPRGADYFTKPNWRWDLEEAFPVFVITSIPSSRKRE